MNRPTVPPLRRRGEDPVLDALVAGAGDDILFARVERRLRRVSWMPEPRPLADDAPWARRYARTLVLLTFALLAPGLVGVSLVLLEWSRDRLRAGAVGESAAPVAAPHDDHARPESAPGAPNAASAPAASTPAPVAAPSPTEDGSAKATPSGPPSASHGRTQAPPSAEASSSAPVHSAPTPSRNPTFTPELTY